MHNTDAGAIVPGRDLSDRQLLERFIAYRDESAFAGLVERYSRSVWGVCRRVLHQEQDVEDAFQAVFFILARKAASLRKKEAVGSWLYGVAYRTALKARRTTTRRQIREKKAVAPIGEPQPWGEAAFRELQRVLDEEVDRLAEKYRAPFVLCCLEGKTKPEAARELGWSEGTVSGRLAQARKLLQSRLARRGITLSAVLTGLALTQNAASAAAPAILVGVTVKGVLAPAAGHALTPTALALAKEMLHGMVLAKLKVGLAALATLFIFVAGATLVASHLTSEDRPEVRSTAVAVRSSVPWTDTQPVPPRTVTRSAGNKTWVSNLALSPDGNRLVLADGFAGESSRLRIWDVTTAHDPHFVNPIADTRIVALSPDGRTLAAGEFGGEIRLRNAASGLEEAVVAGHAGGVTCLAFSPDGRWLVSGDSFGFVKLWNLLARKELGEFRPHADQVTALAFFHRSRTVVSAGKDNLVRLWSPDTDQELTALPEMAEALALSPDDRLVATVRRDSVRLWDTSSGAPVASFTEHNGPLSTVAFSPDGRLLASGSLDGSLSVWDIQTRQLAARLPRHTTGVRALRFSPDGQRLLTGGNNGPVTYFVDHLAAAARPEALQEYYHSFKEQNELPPGWELKGPSADEWVHPEASGVRLELPAGKPAEARGTGVGVPLVVQGDFDITTSFDLLQEPAPAAAGSTQTRVSIEVLLNRPTDSRNMASLSRRVSNDGASFMSWQALRDEGPVPEQTKGRLLTTVTRSGRLRLTRTGSLLTYYVAEGSQGDFTLLQQTPFGTEDLKEVRLVASTGGPTASLEARFVDLRIRARALPNLAAVNERAPVRIEPPPDGPLVIQAPESNSWLLATELLAIGVACALLSAFGGWLYWRHARPG